MNVRARPRAPPSPLPISGIGDGGRGSRLDQVLAVGWLRGMGESLPPLPHEEAIGMPGEKRPLSLPEIYQIIGPDSDDSDGAAAATPPPRRSARHTPHAPAPLAQPLQYAYLAEPRGVVEAREAPKPTGLQARGASGVPMYILAMQWGDNVAHKADAIRLRHLCSACKNIYGFFTTEDNRSKFVSVPGFAMSYFHTKIRFCEELKPSIIALDWNWAPQEYYTQSHLYNSNWFTGKIHDAMRESGAEVFLMPNSATYDTKGGNSFMDAYFEDGFKEYNSKSDFKLGHFHLSTKQAEACHPLVVATIAAQADLKAAGREVASKGWETQRLYADADHPFIVLFPADRPPQLVLRFLQYACGDGGLSGE